MKKEKGQIKEYMNFYEWLELLRKHPDIDSVWSFETDTEVSYGTRYAKHFSEITKKWRTESDHVRKIRYNYVNLIIANYHRNSKFRKLCKKIGLALEDILNIRGTTNYYVDNVLPKAIKELAKYDRDNLPEEEEESMLYFLLLDIITTIQLSETYTAMC